jgi:anti-anti-sigma factor
MSTNVPGSSSAAGLVYAAKEGNWLPPVEFLTLAVNAAASTGARLTLSLENIHYLDAEALQILLVLQTDCEKHGKQLLLTHVSPSLARWFVCAGAERHLCWS